MPLIGSIEKKKLFFTIMGPKIIKLRHVKKLRVIKYCKGSSDFEHYYPFKMYNVAKSEEINDRVFP